MLGVEPATVDRVREGDTITRTAPGRLEGMDNEVDEDDNALFKVYNATTL